MAGEEVLDSLFGGFETRRGDPQAREAMGSSTSRLQAPLWHSPSA
jgi:hypothetical protein